MIIGLSGKKQSGKDTVAAIIRLLIALDKNPNAFYGDKSLPIEAYPQVIEAIKTNGEDYSRWQRKLFADKLKDIVCMLIGCPREQLEDNTFKETPLGKEWDIWRGTKLDDKGNTIHIRFNTEEEAQKELTAINESGEITEYMSIYMTRMTPRLLLQLIGTECGRQIIHPNIWVNALMSEYKQAWLYDKRSGPNWIITDVRFPNEVKAIKNKGGLVFRIDRPSVSSTDTHESETALDNYKEFDGYINNLEGIDLLVDQVSIMSKHFKII